MYKSISIIFIPLAHLSLHAADLDTKVAELSHDFSLVSQELAQLRLDFEDLSQKNQELLQQIQTLQLNIQKNKQYTDTQNAKTLTTINKQLQTLISKTPPPHASPTVQGKDTPPHPGKSNSLPPSQPNFNNNYPKEGISYTIKPGDTLSVIALKNNSSTNHIQNANRITDPRALRPGQVIFIPQKTK